MMNENSPIWQKQKPLCTAVFSGLPLSSTPVVAANDLKSMMQTAIISTVSQYFPSTAGWISIPTETKKTALKRFFKGVIKR